VTDPITQRFADQRRFAQLVARARDLSRDPAHRAEAPWLALILPLAALALLGLAVVTP